jgi:hypothetical protein
MAMKSPMEMKPLMGKSSINGEFSVAIFDYERVIAFSSMFKTKGL